MRRAFDWEAAGFALGETLGEYCAIVVIGTDPVTTGRVAVGVGRAQATKRRVAVGDLFAESPPIQELVETDDPHGLVDSFLYGVSLSKIAHEVRDAGELYVMPSGTEPPTYEEILPNPRWHRLTAGFREVGALLVLAAPASAPHIEDLVAATDGAVLVGEAVPRKLPVANVIGSVREPKADAAAEEESVAVPPVERRWTRRQRFAAGGGVLLTLALAFVAFWLATRPISVMTRGHTAVPQKPDTSRAKTVAGLGRDSLTADSARDSLRDTVPVGAVVATPAISDPADSATAAAFAVELSIANTEAGAILKLQENGKNLPAATFSPVLIQGSRWFKVVGGAFINRGSADSLLAVLRQRKIVEPGSGSVVRLPFAFLIEVVTAAAVPGMLAAHADHGIPVYALRQDDGSAWLLAGAFETTDQASLYAESLRASGITPKLVYRKGRMF